jgi:hypothetical protein
MRQIIDKTTGAITEYTDAEYEKKRDELLIAWQNSKVALEQAKELEMQLRKQVVDFAFDPNKQSGTERVQLGNGYEAKAVKKLNYGFVKNSDGKLDKAAIDKALSKIEKDGPAGELVAERLVKWTPDLSLSEYKLLSEKHKAIIDSVIVTTEGAPTLEIIEPKNK